MAVSHSICHVGRYWNGKILPCGCADAEKGSRTAMQSSPPLPLIEWLTPPVAKSHQRSDISCDVPPMFSYRHITFKLTYFSFKKCTFKPFDGRTHRYWRRRRRNSAEAIHWARILSYEDSCLPLSWATILSSNLRIPGYCMMVGLSWLRAEKNCSIQKMSRRSRRIVIPCQL